MSLEVRTPTHAVPAIHQFLRAHLATARAEGVVVGLSGGIDSAVVAQLARDALGGAKVLGVLLPGRVYPEELRAETLGFAHALGIRSRTVELAPVEAALEGALPELAAERVAAGNMTARLRMAVLYALAREAHALVLGTGNKSELLLGYFTKFGDGAADLLPIGDLYKTDVRAVAAGLGIPEAIRARAPSAGFWEGQTDEGELGLSYDLLDRILLGLEEMRSPEEVSALLGAPREDVERVAARVEAHRHKRRPPPIPKLRLRTVGLDWRD